MTDLVRAAATLPMANEMTSYLYCRTSFNRTETYERDSVLHMYVSAAVSSAFPATIEKEEKTRYAGRRGSTSYSRFICPKNLPEKSSGNRKEGKCHRLQPRSLIKQPLYATLIHEKTWLPCNLHTLESNMHAIVFS